MRKYIPVHKLCSFHPTWGARFLCGEFGFLKGRWRFIQSTLHLVQSAFLLWRRVGFHVVAVGWCRRGGIVLNVGPALAGSRGRLRDVGAGGKQSEAARRMSGRR
jgi:hypothetical protein